MIYGLALWKWIIYNLFMPDRYGQFVKGEIPWNKGTKGVMKPNSGSFKEGHGEVDLNIRFLEKVNKTENCWLWTGSKNNKGYGRINVRGKVKLAHRIGYELYFMRYVSDAIQVLHKCDTPSCVKPAHLFLGNAKDNMQDMSTKKRGCNGERAPWAKLTQKKVEDIRNIYTRGGTSMRKLAKSFGVSFYTIWAIINNKSWK